MTLSSYSKIYALGHRELGDDFFAGDVVVEEKLDGSQFSFGVDEDGVLHCRSKGATLNIDEPEKMFTRAVDTAKRLAPQLVPGWTYRGEYLQKPKHNALAYLRVPAQHIALFDIDTGDQSYLPTANKRQVASELGLETVPTLFLGRIESLDALKAMLEHESFLGGTKPEGFVVKRYDQFGGDKKVLMGKYVTEAFKEVHAKEWKVSNPTRKDVIQDLIERHRTEARWQKAVQHLREAGTLDGSPKDIGALLREVPDDILAECLEDIKQALFDHAWPQIRRGVTAGLPQWYKDTLAASAFSEVSA